MKCIFCGKELRDGSLFCANCGKEAEIVPDYNAFEDDYLKAILEKENTLEPKQVPTLDLQLEQKKIKLKKKQEAEKKKKEQKKKIIIISLIITVCILVLVVALFIHFTMEKKNAQSYVYQVEQAEEAYDIGNVDEAILFYEKALEIEPNDVDVRLALAEIHMKQEEYDSAMVLFHEILNMESENVEAYKNLILIYEKKKDVDAIVALSEGISNEEILNLFTEYIVLPPTFSEDEGTYKEYIDIKLTASDPRYEIYYTLDGKDPIQYGKKYSRKIPLDEMGEYELKAVCVNEKDIYSEVVHQKFVIDIPAPEMPTVTPDGGNFDVETQVTVVVPVGCSAYFTWDGTDPTITSTKYTGPITVPEGNNVLAVILIDDTTALQSAIYRGNFIYYTE